MDTEQRSKRFESLGDIARRVAGKLIAAREFGEKEPSPPTSTNDGEASEFRFASAQPPVECSPGAPAGCWVR